MKEENISDSTVFCTYLRFSDCVKVKTIVMIYYMIHVLTTVDLSFMDVKHSQFLSNSVVMVGVTPYCNFTMCDITCCDWLC